jgi:hypothetical protein
MIQNNSDEADEVNLLAKAMGIPYTVRLSPELLELIKPNEFLTSLGIQYSERVKGILSVLKGNMIPEGGGLKETLPKGSAVIPFNLVKGPFIREEAITIKAEMSDVGGETGILLTAILETE